MKTPTPTQAIIDKCKECIYDPEALGAGTWRKQVEDCTAPDCPLFPLRPVTQEEQRRRKEERLAAMTPEERAKHDRKTELARERFNKARKQ